MGIEIKNKNGIVIYTYEGANLEGANLEGANLEGADLSGANLVLVNLSGANLRSAHLSGANLSGAYLSGANLVRANLVRANLECANLVRANLEGADLYGANLSGANLSGANLEGADLCGANLVRATLPHFQIVPSEGEFVAWKKTTTGVIRVKIPADAARTSSPVGRKCRASRVIVIDAGGKSPMKGALDYSEVGAVVTADKFDDDIRVECTNGIHFFMTKAEAESY
jgi:hypothetical protein